MVPGKAGRAKKTPGPEQLMDLLIISRRLGDFGSHFGAHLILKMSQNPPVAHKIKIKSPKRAPMRRLNKTCVWVSNRSRTLFLVALRAPEERQRRSSYHLGPTQRNKRESDTESISK